MYLAFILFSYCLQQSKQKFKEKLKIDLQTVKQDIS